jgi:response regulator RpfG family c-di-GMP phosphodiesterase
MNDADGGSTERGRMARKHILAVNGASDFLEFVRILFESEHYNVTTTNFVDRTHAVIEALQPDMVIVDIVVGQQAGWDLLEQLHREVLTRDIPLLLTSTAPALLTRAQADADRYGNQRAIAKPMDVDELLRTTQEIIGEA